MKPSKKDEEEIVFVKRAGTGLQLNRGDVEDLGGPMSCFDKKDTRSIWMRISGLNGDIQMLKKDCNYQFMIDTDDGKTLRVKDVRIGQIFSDDIICSAQSIYQV